MLFRSPSNDPIHISTLSGHAAVIGPEWRELPEFLHHAALAAGAECDQERVVARKVEPASAPDAMAREADYDDVYRTALAKMIERNEDGDFTADGLPNTNIVSKLCGLSARKNDVLRVYRAMQAEAGA